MGSDILTYSKVSMVLDKNIVAKETTRYSKGSYQKAKDLLGWEPNTDIESEVKRVTLQIK